MAFSEASWEGNASEQPFKTPQYGMIGQSRRLIKKKKEKRIICN